MIKEQVDSIHNYTDKMHAQRAAKNLANRHRQIFAVAHDRTTKKFHPTAWEGGLRTSEGHKVVSLHTPSRLREDAPANAAGGGHVAGLGQNSGEPGGRPRGTPTLRRKKIKIP